MKDQYKNGVQHHIHEGAGDHTDGADVGGAVGLDLDLQVIGYGKEDGKGGDGAYILFYIHQGVRGGTQEQGHPLQVEEDQGTQQQAGNAGDEQILIEIIPGAVQIPLAQRDGDDRGSTGGQQDPHHKDQRGKGHGQIHGRQGVFSHPPGHEDAVHHGVKGEDPHGDDGWDDELEKPLEQVQSKTSFSLITTINPRIIRKSIPGRKKNERPL